MLIGMRLFAATMALLSLLYFSKIIFLDLPAELQNNPIVQDIYTGKVAIFMLIPSFIFGGIISIPFSLYLKWKGKNSD